MEDVARTFEALGVHSALWIWRSYRKPSWGFELVHEDELRRETVDVKLLVLELRVAAPDELRLQLRQLRLPLLQIARLVVERRESLLELSLELLALLLCAEELDALNEYFYDAQARELRLVYNGSDAQPPSEVTVPALESIIVIRGSVDVPVRNVTLHGLTFRDTRPTYMDPRNGRRPT